MYFNIYPYIKLCPGHSNTLAPQTINGNNTALYGQTIVDIAMGYRTSAFVTAAGKVYTCGENNAVCFK
jgi:alpha-tubulin suppressor-like RCC1 family protein